MTSTQQYQWSLLLSHIQCMVDICVVIAWGGSCMISPTQPFGSIALKEGESSERRARSTHWQMSALTAQCCALTAQSEWLPSSYSARLKSWQRERPWFWAVSWRTAWWRVITGDGWKCWLAGFWNYTRGLTGCHFLVLMSSVAWILRVRFLGLSFQFINTQHVYHTSSKPWCHENFHSGEM